MSPMKRRTPAPVRKTRIRRAAPAGIGAGRACSRRGNSLSPVSRLLALVIEAGRREASGEDVGEGFGRDGDGFEDGIEDALDSRSPEAPLLAKDESMAQDREDELLDVIGNDEVPALERSA